MAATISRFARKLMKRADVRLRNEKTAHCLYCQLYQLSELSSTLPDARGPPVIGTVASIVKSKGGAELHEYVDALHKRHGSLFRGRIGPFEAVFVSDPDAIRKLYSLEGLAPQSVVPEAWLLYNERRQRARGLLFM
ncbi:cytochrome P450 315a1, mitochondrial-like [Copidosoma floridanum]|uniref:cytochrome P450 315a1, mitochondrial-like n=1 Tax=Copidosoma floridanum TaxID=29053 RepID=UPI0006C9B5CC|nr:cytochrome P450 315a1, mitochondrial-like [Copidosoma floridanum]